LIDGREMMAKRFIVKRDVYVVDRTGRQRFYRRNHVREDGTVGYTPEEIKGLSRDHLRMFTENSVDGEGVEQATAAPGEKRSVSTSREDTAESEVDEADSE
jgi:hypothetical protein